MNSPDDDNRLRIALSRQLKRLEREHPKSVLGLLVTGGTAGLLLVVPIVAGAYLGRWLDEQTAGYSVRWTLNLILLGLAIGVFNVVQFFRRSGR